MTLRQQGQAQRSQELRADSVTGRQALLYLHQARRRLVLRGQCGSRDDCAERRVEQGCWRRSETEHLLNVLLSHPPLAAEEGQDCEIEQGITEIERRGNAPG